MGLRLPPYPDDYGPGDDCLACHAAGKTPNYVFVRFWDVAACPGAPDPPNGFSIVCKQHVSSNCLWYGQIDFEGNTWSCYYYASVLSQEIYIASLLLVCSSLHIVASFTGVAAECGVVFDVNQATCDGWSGTGGRGIVSVYVDPILIALIGSFGFYDEAGILYDSFDVTSPDAVYHIAHVADKTNVLFLIDKDEL